MPKDYAKYLAEELLDVQRTLGWMDLVISSIDDAVAVIHNDGRIIYANDAFSGLADVPRVFLLGQRMNDVLPLRRVGKSSVDKVNSKLAAAKEEYNGIYEATGGRNHTRTLKVATRDLPSTDQRVFLIQNITEEYELTRMKDDFIDFASHQLRTPITAIMTYAHMLRDGYAGELQPDQQAITDIVIESSERMIRLVNDLLDITRVQSYANPGTTKPVNVPLLLNRIYSEVEPRIKEKNLNFIVSIKTELAEVPSSQQMLHQSFSNLIINAVQYTRKDGTIEIIVEADSDHMIVSVKDNGIGIPKEYQAKLFNQFARADNALEEYPQGTGLGLYIVKLMLDKVGGSIRCESKLHKGTCFTVLLPLKSAS